MKRLGQCLFPAVIALVLLLLTPAAVSATVSIGCSFNTSAISSVPLTETVTLTCPADLVAQVDASLTGPATVNFYSGPDLNWTKSVSVPTAGKYRLKITITVTTDAGPVTGTSTCCGTTVYDAAPTPTPAPVITPAPAITPRPATPAPAISPRPATPAPVVPTATPAPTDSPAPTATPSASPSESPSSVTSPSESTTPVASPSGQPTPSAGATPAPTASPSSNSAPAALAATGGGSNFELLPVAALGGLWLMTAALLALLALRRQRRQATLPADRAVQ